MRLVYLGDIVGRAGRDAVVERAGEIRRRLDADLLIVNGENAAGGFGITQKICEDLYAAGVDVISTGNHVWDQRELLDYIDSDPRLIRPINFPAGTPGRGATMVESARGHQVLVINAMGRIFMDPLDDPFAGVEEQLALCRLRESVDAIVVDIHAEASSEKMAMGHFCDGRASFVVGSHSHVPTADAQILPGGTAYQTDAGMCGDYDSVIGMEKTEPLNRFTRKIAQGRFAPAMGEATVCGVAVETDPATGLAVRIAPIRLGGRLAESFPDWAAQGRAAAE
ncbi:MAG: YmdB family metallophosphoesterase [Alphaproteobacteria bacterium]|nr:YmdB family metallophosphoesterase [Alphaproteobacteria bacterium]MDX5368863.1 YmdB family metallophosphoesterase [Alphaproteobacteria bacterium]MDX5463588.1 YmdB family metallophosphoesterase [Alphaproteobacteria bacterium]